MVSATLHVLGALAVSVAFGLLVIGIGAWEMERVKKRRLQEMSVSLGVPLALMESEALVPKLIEYSSKRYSGELLRNRLADLCGVVRTAWGFLGSFVQLVAIGMVGWQLCESGSNNAALMWIVPALALFFWLISVAFSFACLLLTGRYPGEPKESRKSLASIIERRGVPAEPTQPLTAAGGA
jgi:hypothetical protein